MLNFHFRGPKKQRVPKWMRKYIIGYLGKIFCFCHESNLFYQTFEDENKKFEAANYENKNKTNNNKKILIKSKSNNNDNKNKTNNKFKTISHSNLSNEYLNYNTKENDHINGNNDLLNFKKITTENKEYNFKENRIVLEYSNNQEDCRSNQKYNSDLNCVISNLNENNIKIFPKQNEKGNKLNLGSELTPFNDRISKNLEKMLIKLQKSFDPFKLQDENLKFEMLKEILECQRLLLQANLNNRINNRRQKQMTINEIYDEWKILAMIVDRICFFIYLFALIGSSVLFFFQENLINE